MADIQDITKKIEVFWILFGSHTPGHHEYHSKIWLLCSSFKITLFSSGEEAMQIKPVKMATHVPAEERDQRTEREWINKHIARSVLYWVVAFQVQVLDASEQLETVFRGESIRVLVLPVHVCNCSACPPHQGKDHLASATKDVGSCYLQKHI